MIFCFEGLGRERVNRRGHEEGTKDAEEKKYTEGLSAFGT
jgi:hypothetical protein